MRTMGRALLLLLVVAFLAGVWDTRYGREATPRRAAAPFGTEPVERARPARPAPELVSVATAERDGYDRVVFTFEGPLPGYQVRYVPRVTDAGGRRLPVAGAAFLEVVFEPARAHGPDGRPTFPDGTPPRARRRCARSASPATSRARSASAWGWPHAAGSGSPSSAARPGWRWTSAESPANSGVAASTCLRHHRAEPAGGHGLGVLRRLAERSVLDRVPMKLDF